MGIEHERLKEILAEAVGKETPEARASYLDVACGGDAELRQKIEGLLEAHERAGDYFEKSVVPPQETLISEGPGTVIGRYKLLQEIGEGGFGRVFMAEQLEPVQRKVALKIIKAGMDTREVIARLEAERQALALMDHPNIARVFDAGATESGRPYFVMELVKGIKITEYCDQNNLSTEERLKLFIKVCHAIQHAHQKGIIHRDLKPSNVMVTLHDGEAVPKVIDFGIAKATGKRLTEKTLFTRYEQMIGTPAYMSPEQAAMSGLDIDTRTDIYALGVLLYELLTGVTPFDKETLAKAAFDEVRRMIRETEPPKPSTRLAEMARSQESGARDQKAEGRWKEMRGDLDWIAMKALEKDRQRRYESANDFAEDIQRHLQHEAVLASPPSAMYRARKFVRRNRVGVALAAVVLSVLGIGLTVSLIGFAQAKRERDRAVAAEIKAGHEARRAEAESDIARAVSEFLQNDLLSQASPYQTPDHDVTLRTMVDRAAEKVGIRFQDKPLVEAEIRVTLSIIYRELLENDKARVHLNRALDIYKQQLSPEDPRFLKARGYDVHLLPREGRAHDGQLLGEELLPLHLRVFGAEHQCTIDVMQDLAWAYHCQGKLTETERLFEQWLPIMRRVLGAEHSDTLNSVMELARVYIAQGRVAEGQKLQEDVLAARRRHLAPQHPFMLATVAQLANTYISQGKFAQAQKLREENVSGTRRLLGDEAPDTLVAMYHLAASYIDTGQPQEAQKRLEEVLPAMRRVLGSKGYTLNSMAKLASIYREQGELAKAQALHEELLTIRRRILGAEHVDTLHAMLSLAKTYRKQNNLVKTEELLDKAWAICSKIPIKEDSITLANMHDLAIRFMEVGQPARCHEILEKLLPVMRRVLGPEHRTTLLAMTNLTVAYNRLEHAR